MKISETKKCNMKNKITLFFAGIILVAIGFGAGVYVVGNNELLKGVAVDEAVYIGNLLGKYSDARPGYLPADIDFSLFWDTWDIVENYYVDEDNINEKQMFYGALRGLVASLNDPYTVFMDPKITQDFSEDLSGTFEGIGAEIGMKNDILTIIAPLPGMPAEKAGLKAGDKIYAIDGEATVGIGVDEAVKKIKGPKGTQVVLTIFREDFDNVKDISITRDKIVVESVRTSFLDNGIFLMEIINFNNDTERGFNNAVSELIKADAKGIVLDLRNNPGGYLDSAIEIASEWIEDGVIVEEKGREEELNEHFSRGRARLKDYPTVILVNQGSASASEIVAGALQDYGEATIVGKQTFGKGSVQTLTNLNDGSSIKITVTKWFTPNGRSISDEGITPDEDVELTIDDYNNDKDPQMDRAIEILASGINTGN